MVGARAGRRLTIARGRDLAHRLGVAPSQLNDFASVHYAKVVEDQLRGAVHFHALIRLDGPKSPEGFSPAPSELMAGDPEAPLCGEQVAGYLTKYATKSATEAEARAKLHFRRLHATATHLSRVARASDGDPNDDYDLLGKWAHTLGFAATSPRSPAATRSPSANCVEHDGEPNSPLQPHTVKAGASTFATSRPNCSPTTRTRPPSSAALESAPAAGGPTPARPP